MHFPPLTQTLTTATSGVHSTQASSNHGIHVRTRSWEDLSMQDHPAVESGFKTEEDGIKVDGGGGDGNGWMAVPQPMIPYRDMGQTVMCDHCGVQHVNTRSKRPASVTNDTLYPTNPFTASTPTLTTHSSRPFHEMTWFPTGTLLKRPKSAIPTSSSYHQPSTSCQHHTSSMNDRSTQAPALNGTQQNVWTPRPSIPNQASQHLASMTLTPHSNFQPYANPQPIHAPQQTDIPIQLVQPSTYQNTLNTPAPQMGTIYRQPTPIPQPPIPSVQYTRLPPSTQQKSRIRKVPQKRIATVRSVAQKAQARKVQPAPAPPPVQIFTAATIAEQRLVISEFISSLIYTLWYPTFGIGPMQSGSDYMGTFLDIATELWEVEMEERSCIKESEQMHYPAGIHTPIQNRPSASTVNIPRVNSLPPPHVPTDFTTFLQALLMRMKVCPPVLTLACFYVMRLRDHLLTTPRLLPTQPGSECRVVVLALMLASKYLEDNTYSNASWAEISGIATTEIAAMELEFLRCLGFACAVNVKVFERWSEMVRSMKPGVDLMELERVRMKRLEKERHLADALAYDMGREEKNEGYGQVMERECVTVTKDSGVAFEALPQMPGVVSTGNTYPTSSTEYIPTIPTNLPKIGRPPKLQHPSLTMTTDPTTSLPSSYIPTQSTQILTHAQAYPKNMNAMSSPDVLSQRTLQAPPLPGMMSYVEPTRTTVQVQGGIGHASVTTTGAGMVCTSVAMGQQQHGWNIQEGGYRHPDSAFNGTSR